MKSHQIEVVIQSFSKDGHGKGVIAFPEGKQSPIEVPFTAPGDRVNAWLLPKRRGSYQSRLLEIIEPSPQRIQPKCIHFSSCGGCRLQHLAYEQQLQMKEEFVRKQLAPYLTEEVIFHPILACDPPWNYRNKMEFSFSSDKAQNRYLGLMLQGGGGRVFNITECHLANHWFIDGVKVVRKWWESSSVEAYHSGKNTGSLRTLTMREGQRTGDRMVMLTVSGNPDFALQKSQINEFVSCLREAIEPTDANQKLSIFLRIHQIAKGTPTNFYEMLLYGPDHIREVLNIEDHENRSTYPLTFRISPTAFFQPNSGQAEKLYSRALQMIQMNDGDTVYDLYCGTGTLGICAAKKAKMVLGIEICPESVLDAGENIKLNGINNVEVIKGDVGKTLAQLALDQQGRKPDVVMVDPPRAGLDNKALQHLIELKAAKILYISCNPITQAANLEELINAGYRLEAVQSVDQFPHTVHIENIVVLKRS